MNSFYFAFTASVILFCQAMAADDIHCGGADEAARLLKSAISEAGGVDKIRKMMERHYSTSTRTFYSGSESLTIKDSVWIEMPGRYRCEMRHSTNGQVESRGFLLDGEKGWNSQSGKYKEMNESELFRIKTGLRHRSMDFLIPLLEKDYTLSLMGDENKQHPQLAAISVAYKGKKDAELYFDKKTLRLVKTVTRMLSDEVKGEQAETLYQDYKMFGGIWCPSRIECTISGRKYCDIQRIEIRAVELHIPGTFDPKDY